MTNLLAEFITAEQLTAGAQTAGQDGFVPSDALTPYPLGNIDDIVPKKRRASIRVPMAIAGLGSAAAMFALESWSAVSAYPFNEGGRPNFSWPVFLLVPFEFGVLLAGIAGMIALFVACGLPRLHHPIFDVGNVERASQDRFFLLFDHPGEERLDQLRALLLDAGAVQIAEAAEA